MEFHEITIGKLKRQLPIVALGPKLKVASFNILGDKELVGVAAQRMCALVKDIHFDYLVGPEITVLPLIHEMAGILKMPRYVIMRKQVHGYMQHPIESGTKPGLVLNGIDADLLQNKSVLIVDDIVSTGRTIAVMSKLLKRLNVSIVGKVTILKQGERFDEGIEDLMYLQKIPLFTV